MTKKIGITGVGGGVGQSIIKSLSGTNYQIVGLDGDDLATGLYCLPNSFKIPYANSSNYIDKLLNICKNEKIDLLFPGLDAELMTLSNNREKFVEIGTTVVVSNPFVIELSDNKLQTYKQLNPHGINVPITLDMDDFINNESLLNYPIIIKQKIGGARSKNVFIISNKNALDTFVNQQKANLGQFIAQEYIEGDEFTCGSINLDGRCMGVIVMRRILRDGDTYKCFSVKNEIIERTVTNIMNIIKPFGACNVQLRIRNGIPYVFEINARCSGTTASRTLCGFNEPKMIADYLLHNTMPSFTIKELTILRYWNELAVENYLIDSFKENGQLENKLPSYL